MIRGECVGRWRQAEIWSGLDGDGGLRLLRWIGLRSDGYDHRVWLRWIVGRGVIRSVGDRAGPRSLRGDYAQNAAGTPAATRTGERPRQHVAGIGTRNWRKRCDNRRGCPGLQIGWRRNLQREMARNGHSSGGLLGRISGAGGDDRKVHGSRQDPRRGVIAVSVDATAASGAGRSSQAPVDRGIGIPAAGDGSVKRLQGAKFHARGNGRERNGDVAGDGHASGRSLRWVGMACCSHLDFAAGRKVCGGRV